MQMPCGSASTRGRNRRRQQASDVSLSEKQQKELLIWSLAEAERSTRSGTKACDEQMVTSGGCLLPHLEKAVKSLYQDEVAPRGKLVQWRLQSMLDGVKVVPMVIREAFSQSTLLYCEPQHFKRLETTFCLHTEPEGFIGFTDVRDEAIPAALWDDVRLLLQEGSWPVPEDQQSDRFELGAWLRDRLNERMHDVTLGRALAIVRRSLSTLGLLGSRSGLLVPYQLSEEHERYMNAEALRPTGVAAGEAYVNCWEQLRICLSILLKESGGRKLSVSHLKTLFRERFSVELSESALGHCTLSELLRDRRLGDTLKFDWCNEGAHALMFTSACDSELPDTPGSFAVMPLADNYASPAQLAIPSRQAQSAQFVQLTHFVRNRGQGVRRFCPVKRQILQGIGPATTAPAAAQQIEPLNYGGGPQMASGVQKRGAAKDSAHSSGKALAPALGKRWVDLHSSVEYSSSGVSSSETSVVDEDNLAYDDTLASSASSASAVVDDLASSAQHGGSGPEPALLPCTALGPAFELPFSCVVRNTFIEFFPTMADPNSASGGGGARLRTRTAPPIGDFACAPPGLWRQ